MYLWVKSRDIVSKGKYNVRKVISPQRVAIRANAEVHYRNEVCYIVPKNKIEVKRKGSCVNEQDEDKQMESEYMYLVVQRINAQ
jgi:hypothetical protein